MPRFTIQYTHPDEAAESMAALSSLLVQSSSIRCIKTQLIQLAGQEQVTEYVVETNWNIARLAGRIADLTAKTTKKSCFSIKPHS